MSGLCGIVRLDGEPVEDTDLDPMVAAAPGRAEQGRRVIGIRGVRLAELGRQGREMFHAERLIVAGDARIDNLQEIGARLGVPDRIGTDRVVAAAYRRWGNAFARHLIGDMALVIWDGALRRLVLARDAMGVRPLYFHIEEDRVLLASEIAQIVAAPGVNRTIDPLAVAHYLAARSAPDHRTFYEGVRTVEPGEVLSIGRHGMTSTRGWEPQIEQGPRRASEIVEAFVEAVVEAVACRRADAQRPGLMLSGGVDSSAIAAAEAAGRRPGSSPLRAYTWAIEGSEEDRACSRDVARATGLELIEIPSDGAWPLADYPEHGPHHDDPFTWVYQPLIDRTLERARADGVDLLMTGDRGDETTGDWIFDDLGLFLAGHAPSSLGGLLAHRRSTGRPLGRVLANRLVRPAVAPGQRTPPLPPPPWLTPQLVSFLEDTEAAVPPALHGPQRARFERIVYGPGSSIALAAERSFAARGLRYAEPWSDRRLTEFVVSLQQWRVQTRSSPKLLAHQALARLLPDGAAATAVKSDPAGLFDMGLRDKAAGTVSDLLDEPRGEALGFFTAAEVRADYHEYLDGRPPLSDFWRPLTLEMWLRRYW